jgi:hypothetical protein
MVPLLQEYSLKEMGSGTLNLTELPYDLIFGSNARVR